MPIVSYGLREKMTPGPGRVQKNPNPNRVLIGLIWEYFLSALHLNFILVLGSYHFKNSILKVCLLLIPDKLILLKAICLHFDI